MTGTGVYRLARKLLTLCILLSCLLVPSRDGEVNASSSCDTVYF